MPKPKDYPVFTQWYKTTDWILERCERMPKSTRFTVSGRMVNLALDTVELLIEAIYTSERQGLIRQINMKLEKLRFFNRICRDRHYLSMTQYEYLAKAINETGRMCGAWAKNDE